MCRERASAGKSHSKVTPTTSSPAPTANRISVVDGSSDTILISSSVTTAIVTLVPNACRSRAWSLRRRYCPRRVIRVGVTGHRLVVDEGALASSRQRRSSARLRATGPDGRRTIEVWSSLAEGADRIVASLVPDAADRLVVVLPLEPADYCDDFDTIESVERFEHLLAMADRVEIVGADASGSRESAYERAGLRVVEQLRRVARTVGWRDIARGRGGHSGDRRRRSAARSSTSS